jgi:hypothetical protein
MLIIHAQFPHSHVLNMALGVMHINHQKHIKPIITCITPSIYYNSFSLIFHEILHA